MTERISKPKHAITVRAYGDLARYIRGFADGHLNLLILVGRAGTAKSQTVRRAIGKSACWVEGNATPFGIYQKLYQHLDEPVVIDDVDSLYTDRAAVRLLKCVCQTDPIKHIAWTSAAAGLASAGIPRQFETRSRVIIIANDWKTLDANIEAVQDRGHLLLFEPTNEELHRQVAQWFWDQDVYNWFADHLHLIPDLSMRHYVRASELKASGIDWVQVVLSDSVPAKALLVAKLKADSSLGEQRERVKMFRELGGGGQTTWYKWGKRIQSLKDTSHLRIPLKRAQSSEQPALRAAG